MLVGIVGSPTHNLNKYITFDIDKLIIMPDECAHAYSYIKTYIIIYIIFHVMLNIENTQSAIDCDCDRTTLNLPNELICFTPLIKVDQSAECMKTIYFLFCSFCQKFHMYDIRLRSVLKINECLRLAERKQTAIIRRGKLG